jgi:UPF0176 protein
MKKKLVQYTLLTFYAFVDIADPHAEVADHLWFCQDLGLKGRVYIGEEWISATLTGNDGQIRAYKMYLAANPYFQNISDIDAKATKVDAYYFDKMTVKYRREIVALGTTVTQAEIETYRKEMSVEDFKQLVDSGDLQDWVIVDMRNDYEYKLGHFKHAIPAGTINFREVPELLEKYKTMFANKKILWYCTGGVRCEKLSAIVQKAWLPEVYGLDGGVVKYVNAYNDGNWLGNLYTFDGRVSTQVGDETTHTTIGQCIYSDTPTDTCENCRYSPCNARILVDPKEYKKHAGFCSQECCKAAQENLCIKDVARDWYNYQQMRHEIKADPTKLPHLQDNVVKHIAEMLKWRQYRHQTSQKETVIFQD